MLASQPASARCGRADRRAQPAPGQGSVWIGRRRPRARLEMRFKGGRQQGRFRGAMLGSRRGGGGRSTNTDTARLPAGAIRESRRPRSNPLIRHGEYVTTAKYFVRPACTFDTTGAPRMYVCACRVHACLLTYRHRCTKYMHTGILLSLAGTPLCGEVEREHAASCWHTALAPTAPLADSLRDILFRRLSGDTAWPRECCVPAIPGGSKQSVQAPAGSDAHDWRCYVHGLAAPLLYPPSWPCTCAFLGASLLRPPSLANTSDSALVWKCWTRPTV